ncbi:CopD family protein [Streptomyces yaizuensis]|uniref:CopD family protein n=1 Tax=Streptomyces yaizuensis TaxID=2989713 RepID=A0ABQ5NWM6_9ACTN|nr:CopD family protein [Streptomyces sp. YSPA8]
MTSPGALAPGRAARRRAARRTARRTAALVLAGLLGALAVALLAGPLAARGTGELRVPAAGTTTVLRTVVFAALAVHIGELAGRRVAGDGPRPRDWSLYAALAGAAGAAGQIVVHASVSDIDLATAYGTRDGRLLLLMANGFLAAAACVRLRRPRLAALPLLLIVGAEAVRAHPEQYTPLIGTLLTLLHLPAAALWTGGLLHALRVMGLRRGDRAGALAVLRRYARTALWPLAVLALTGTASTLRKLPPDVVLGSAYGRLLLVKTALVGVVCALALAARHRMRRGRLDAQLPARVELGFLVAVTVVSAVLTVVPDPHWVSTRLGIR